MIDKFRKYFNFILSLVKMKIIFTILSVRIVIILLLLCAACDVRIVMKTV